MNVKLLELLHNKSTVLFEGGCMSKFFLERDSIYAKRLLSLLKNKGINVHFIITNEDIKSIRTPPEGTLAVVMSQSYTDAAKEKGFSVVGMAANPLETEFSVPDLHSLYNIINWVFNTYHLPKGEDYEPMHKITTVILAAGKGTRLGFDKSKVLYPFCGRTALEIMYAKVQPFSDRIIVVPSSDGEKEICAHLKEKNLPAEIMVDTQPYGTGGSAAVTLENIKDFETVAIVWGAQIGLPQQALRNLIFLHQKHNACLSLPTKIRKNPYIHLERNEIGVIQNVLRKRWNNEMPLYGENEGGFFVFNGGVLRKILGSMNEEYVKNLRLKSRARQGFLNTVENPSYSLLKQGEYMKQEDSRSLKKRELAVTETEAAEELDLLDIIPLIAAQNHSVLTSSCILDEGKLGFKSKEEAAYHEERIRQGIPY